MILHLGVIDLPYANAPRGKRAKVSRGTQTTGDVATWLENRYGLMETYVRVHENVIADSVGDSIKGAIETLAMGGRIDHDPFGTATSKIEDDFKQFLSSGEVDTVGIPGTPTKAAERGVNHRLKHPYRRRKARPSFLDTTLFQSSFKAWVD